MIPVGYMAKKVSARPDWLKTGAVEDIYSVSGCTSKDFCDYINYWKHNGYWLFDSPDAIRALAEEHGIDLSGTMMFYYEIYEKQCANDAPEWTGFFPEPSFTTDVQPPADKVLEGFDIVTFSGGNSPECSYLSCNHMAETLPVNKHCLFRTFDEAKQYLEKGVFRDCEPGPCRIFAVYRMKTA